MNREQLIINSEQRTINKFKKSWNYIYLLSVICYLLSCTIPESPEIKQNIPYDPDLHSWKTASWTPFRDTDRITGFAYGNINGKDRYVAVAGTGIIGWSDNGDHWFPANLKDQNDNPIVLWNLNAVVFGDGLFVAVGNGGRYIWSNNGIDWEITTEIITINENQIITPVPMTGFGTENIFGIAYGRITHTTSYFVAVGGNANISYSSNGKDWAGCKDDAFGTSQLNDITYSSQHVRFYIVGNDGKRGYSGSPSSGNWNYRGPEAPFHTNHIRKVAAGNYRNHIGIGIVFNEWGGKRTAISTNENFIYFDADLDDVLLQNNEINDITWGGSHFVVGGSTSMIGHWNSSEPSLFSSRIWRALPFHEFDRWAITSVEALNGRFFIGNSGGKIGYSK